MKLHCSQLNSDLFNNNIIDNRYLLVVRGNYISFFDCPMRIMHRHEMYNEIDVANVTLHIILNGDDGLNHHDNVIIHEAVSSYIKATKRFNMI